MAQMIHFVRHGEVHNPEKILYGLQPGWRLSERGNQMAQVVQATLWNVAPGKDLDFIETNVAQRLDQFAVYNRFW